MDSSLSQSIFSHPALRQLIHSRQYSSYSPPLGLPHANLRSTKLAIYSLMILNTAVFGTWYYAQSTRNHKLSQTLHDHTMLGWTNIRAGRYYTTITSAFTHQSASHFLGNMISLYAFSSALMLAGGVGIGALPVLGLTLGSALAGSAAFLYQTRPSTQQSRRAWGRNVQSGSWACGASGVVMGFGAAATCLMPFWKMMIIPIPVPIPMWALTLGYAGYDYFYLSANDGIGHAAHLGGALFGVLYYLTTLRKFGGVLTMMRRGRRRGW